MCEMERQTYYVHSCTIPNLCSGPHHCSPAVDIADHLPLLLRDKLTTEKDRVFVVVFPSCSCSQVCSSFAESTATNIYELPLETEETRVSLDDVRNRLYTSYGRDLLDEETLCVWTAMGDLNNCCKYIRRL